MKTYLHFYVFSSLAWNLLPKELLRKVLMTLLVIPEVIFNLDI